MTTVLTFEWGTEKILFDASVIKLTKDLKSIFFLSLFSQMALNSGDLLIQ